MIEMPVSGFEARPWTQPVIYYGVELLHKLGDTTDSRSLFAWIPNSHEFYINFGTEIHCCFKNTAPQRPNSGRISQLLTPVKLGEKWAKCSSEKALNHWCSQLLTFDRPYRNQRIKGNRWKTEAEFSSCFVKFVIFYV